MKKLKIQINEKDYEVKSSPLVKLLDALKILKEYPDNIGNIDLEDKEKNVAVMIDLISTSSGDIFGILFNLSGIPVAEIEVLDLADTLALINAILKVNDIERVKKEFGEIAGMFKQKSKK